jgi:WD40 repeat protein
MSLQAANQLSTPGLFPNPVPVVDPGMHTSRIWSADVDAEARWAVTCSDDKTVRIWSLKDGTPLKTIRLPAGPNRIGQAYSVAISPDGALLAVGGWTRFTDADPQQQIYLFERESAKLLQRIDGLPTYANRLVFSPDGQRLAAVLDSNRGLRIYHRDRAWAEVANDANYYGRSYGLAFAADGRLATSSDDGGVRVYAKDCIGKIEPSAFVFAPSSRHPYGVAFSPDGLRLALGYAYSGPGAIDLLDSQTLALLDKPDCTEIGDGEMSVVAWSKDGGTLFASGASGSDNRSRIFAWDNGAVGMRHVVAVGRDSVNCIVALPGGDILVAGAEP